MEAEHSVGTVYRAVIDEVVSRVKPEFVGEGVDECAGLPRTSSAAFLHNVLTSNCIQPVLCTHEQVVCRRAILDELRVLWETKLTQSGALDPLPAPAACAHTLCLKRLSGGFRNTQAAASSS